MSRKLTLSDEHAAAILEGRAIRTDEWARRELARTADPDGIATGLETLRTLLEAAMSVDLLHPKAGRWAAYCGALLVMDALDAAAVERLTETV